MIKALDVANYIVDYVAKNHSEQKLTHVKLQKIIYYAYATYLKKTKNPLFDDKIEKWQYGPVVRVVYDQFKTYGYSHIDKPKTDLCMRINKEGAIEFVFEEFDPSSINNDAQAVETLKAVVDKLIDFDAFKLVDMTHEEKPWKDFVELIEKRTPNLIYTDEEILKHSQKILA